MSRYTYRYWCAPYAELQSLSGSVAYFSCHTYVNTTGSHLSVTLVPSYITQRLPDCKSHIVCNNQWGVCIIDNQRIMNILEQPRPWKTLQLWRPLRPLRYFRPLTPKPPKDSLEPILSPKSHGEAQWPVTEENFVMFRNSLKSHEDLQSHEDSP